MDLFFSEHAGARTVPDLLEQPVVPGSENRRGYNLPPMRLY